MKQKWFEKLQVGDKVIVDNIFGSYCAVGRVTCCSESRIEVKPKSYDPVNFYRQGRYLPFGGNREILEEYSVEMFGDVRVTS